MGWIGTGRSDQSLSGPRVSSRNSISDQGGQDQVREPVVAAVQLQAEQVIDLVGVEQAGLEPPPGEPAEDAAQSCRQVFVRRDDRPGGWSGP